MKECPMLICTLAEWRKFTYTDDEACTLPTGTLAEWKKYADTVDGGSHRSTAGSTGRMKETSTYRWGSASIMHTLAEWENSLYTVEEACHLATYTLAE